MGNVCGEAPSDPNSHFKYKNYALNFIQKLRGYKYNELADCCEKHLKELIDFFVSQNWNTGYDWFVNQVGCPEYGVKTANNDFRPYTHMACICRAGWLYLGKCTGKGYDHDESKAYLVV